VLGLHAAIPAWAGRAGDDGPVHAPHRHRRRRSRAGAHAGRRDIHDLRCLRHVLRAIRCADPAGAILMKALAGFSWRVEWKGLLIAALLSVAILLPLVNVAVWAFTEVWRYS